MELQPATNGFTGASNFLLGLGGEQLVVLDGNGTLKVTSDKLGCFGYNSNYEAYIEVISFDRLLNAARERNRAFVDKLGLPTA